IDSFNVANNTSYILLSAGSYELSTTSAIIAKGTLATAPLALKVKSGAMNIFTDYLLPVSIVDNKSAIKINEALRTTIFAVRVEPDLKDYTDYDRSQWKIIDYSTEEPAEGN